MRILIVEDEPRIASFLQRGLLEAGYTADVALDAQHGDYLASVNDYKLILLDWLLPERSGLEQCKLWRQNGLKVPIIMITARDGVNDIVDALDCGADDYIVKPFILEEVLARIRAQLRRSNSSAALPELKLHDLRLNPATREVTRGGEPVCLSTKEYKILEYLLRHAGKVVSKSELIEDVWGYMFQTNTNLLEVHINHLRRKLDCGSRIPLIHTVRGAGYVMKVYR